jgi:hypothetical protein
MSKQYDNTNRGVLFINDRKEQDNHPDRKGSINVEGKEYWLSAWNKETAKGDTISLSVTPKDGAKQTASKAGNAKREAEIADDDDIGF